LSSDDLPTPSARLFVALELPEGWRRAFGQLQREQERLAPGYFRWVQPEPMHLTLAFLGSVPRAHVPAVAEAVQRASATVRPFELTVGRIGSFGPPRAPRVLWVEVLQASGRLAQLRSALERELREAALQFDDRPLAAHVTLGRGKRTALRGVRLISESAHVPPFQTHNVVLMESQLSPRGPSYFVRAEAALS
jgi:2'-5' RNA ligase